MKTIKELEAETPNDSMDACWNDGQKQALKEVLEVIDKRIELLGKEILKKQEKFKEKTKQCSFCGSYYGNLNEEIKELIAQKVELEELKARIIGK